MKNLIIVILVLISVMCYGQSGTIENEIDSLFDKTSVSGDISDDLLYSLVNNEDNMSQFVSLITIQSLTDYSEYCYNDSTQMFEWMRWNGINMTCKWDEWGGEEYGYELTGHVKYIHREPTFKDFINWIKDNHND